MESYIVKFAGLVASIPDLKVALEKNDDATPGRVFVPS